MDGGNILHKFASDVLNGMPCCFLKQKPGKEEAKFELGKEVNRICISPLQDCTIRRDLPAVEEMEQRYHHYRWPGELGRNFGERYCSEVSFFFSLKF